MASQLSALGGFLEIQTTKNRISEFLQQARKNYMCWSKRLLVYSQHWGDVLGIDLILKGILVEGGICSVELNIKREGAGLVPVGKRFCHGAFKSWTFLDRMAFLKGGPSQISSWGVFEPYENIFLSGTKIF